MTSLFKAFMGSSSPPVHLEDYTCSICREIFESPVLLSCSHSYCHSCVIGLRKSSSSSSGTSPTSPSTPTSKSGGSSSSPHLHQASVLFTCAICRMESLGYQRNREVESQLSRLKAPCSACTTVFTLKELRSHMEKCSSSSSANLSSKTRKTSGASSPQQATASSLLDGAHLSKSQAEAREKALAGANRSTFVCPFCQKANFTSTHLRQHIKKHHKGEDQHRVCPICVSQPWGDKNLVTANLYLHLKHRHSFDYDTYVNYELDEDAMMRQVMQASLLER